MPNFGFLDKDVAKTCTSPGYCTVFSLFWGNFDLVIKAKRLFLCMALINVLDVGPLLLKKKHALYAYGRRNYFDIDLAWVGLGGGIPLLHFKKIFAQSSTKCYHCHSYLNSDCIKRRLHCCGVCVLI